MATDFLTPEIAESIWNHAVVGVIIVQLKGEEAGRIRHANPAFCQVMEFTLGQLEGKHFRDLTLPADYPDDEEMFRRIQSGEEHEYVLPKRYVTGTERVIWMKLRVDAVIQHDGTSEVVLAQVSPIEQLQPPRLPGDLEVQQARARALNSKIIRWVVIAVISTALAITGGIIGNDALLALGSAGLAGAGIGGYADAKDTPATKVGCAICACDFGELIQRAGTDRQTGSGSKSDLAAPRCESGESGPTACARHDVRPEHGRLDPRNHNASPSSRRPARRSATQAQN